MEVKSVPDNPETVISGSFRKHLEHIHRAKEKFEEAGVKVLAPDITEEENTGDEFVILATDDRTLSPRRLETNFMRNISKASFLYVANVGGYIGKSAATEMAYARLKKLPIITTEEIQTISDEIPKVVQDIIRDSVNSNIAIDSISKDKVMEIRTKIQSSPHPELLPHESKELSSSVINLIRELSSKNT